jgi:hypothetical protein
MAKLISIMTAWLAVVALCLLMLAGCKNSGGNDGNDGNDGNGTVVVTSVSGSYNGSDDGTGELSIPPLGAPSRSAARDNPYVCGEEGVECTPTTTGATPTGTFPGGPANHPPATNLPQLPRPAPTSGG